jgi:hypothetical protein
MSLSDWVISKNQPSTIVTTNTAAPIVNSGSLEIVSTVSPERVTLRNTLYTNGLENGRIQSIISPRTWTSNTREYVGFVFMQNNATAYNVADTGYGVFFSALSALGSPRISVVKYTAGLPASPTELSFTTSFTPPTIGNNFVFEAEWITDPYAALDVRIKAKYATGTNFGSMTTLLDTRDTSSPFFTSSFESVATTFNGSSGTLQVLYDSTSIFSIS